MAFSPPSANHNPSASKKAENEEQHWDRNELRGLFSSDLPSTSPSPLLFSFLFSSLLSSVQVYRIRSSEGGSQRGMSSFLGSTAPGGRQQSYDPHSQWRQRGVTNDEEEEHYYCYPMPDGSWCYAPLGDSQVFSPVDNDGVLQQQPNGYEAPAYGRGTGYGVLQGEHGHAYYYVCGPSAAQEHLKEPQPQPQQRQQQQPPPVETPPTEQPAEESMGANALGETYLPPSTHEDVRLWKGTQRWQSDLCCTCGKHPCYCLSALLCPWCCVGSHRRKMLNGDWGAYVCCAGLCGPQTGSCCPHGACAMCCESFFCLPCAIHGNRFMLMKRHGLRRSSCDNTVSFFTGCCLCVRCCDEPGWSRTACDCLYCLAYPCLIAQQHIEMEKRELPPTSAEME